MEGRFSQEEIRGIETDRFCELREESDMAQVLN